MPGRLQLLKDELTNDPLGRGYAGMTDADAAIDLNLTIRDGPPEAAALLKYLALERFRTGNLIGRIAMVANSIVVRDGGTNWRLPPVPLGLADALIDIGQEHVAAAIALLRFTATDTESVVTLLDSRVDTILDDLGPSGCQSIGAGDKTAIQALSQNRQSRGVEIKFGRVREGNVTEARA